MTVPGNIDALLLGGQRGYQIERSLRFDGSAYLNRTPASAGNRRTFTISYWIKRSALLPTSGGNPQYLFSAGSGTSESTWFQAGVFEIDSLHNETNLATWTTNALITPKFRDTSAWYHFVWSVDTTQASASNRVKAWVNGIEQPKSTPTISQNADLAWNNNVVHYIGARIDSGPRQFADCYLAEVYNIDGQALNHTSFGETDTITGVWKPKKYIHTTSSATSWDYRAYSGTGSPGSWSSMTSVSSGNALGANSSSGTSNPSVAIYSAGAKSKIFRFTGGSGDSRTINVWSSDDGVTWTSQASTTFSVLGSSGHQTTGQYAVYQFANGDFFSSSSYAVTVNDINSFYLKFADNSGTTSTTLGKDSSGNGNNWTPNNFSVTAGAGNDSLIDTPTPYADGGNGRGNYCTLNGAVETTSNGKATLSNGNLECSVPRLCAINGSFGITSGKWYWEVQPNDLANSPYGMGVFAIGKGITHGDTQYIFVDSTGYRYTPGDAANQSGWGPTYNGSTDIIGLALDADARTLGFNKNGGSFTTFDYSSYSSMSGGVTPAWKSGGNLGTSGAIFNFGQRAFAYTPPSGFLALNTQNLPEPSIKKPSSYMDVKLYTGNGTSQTISGLGFSPDLVIAKSRSTGTLFHNVMDSVRGSNKLLYTNSTVAEETISTVFTALTSDGFSVGSDISANKNSDAYVAWCWDESATPGFDIVTYTGTGSATTVAHNLGVAPKMIIAKNRTSASSWDVYHIGLTSANYRVQLNSTGAESVSNGSWNGTAPTSTVFSVKDDTATNSSGASHVAYLWSEVAGFSKFGSYTGNGSSDGPFVFCGFQPKFLLVKSSSSGYDWFIFDDARNTYNAVDLALFPNVSGAESGPNTYSFDFLSNGFKLRNTQLNLNGSGNTYIFAAWAEFPAKYSLAR